MSDKFICAFFYFFRIHLCLKESSKPYSFKSFASLSGQVRAIRTIQFFKEHQKLSLPKSYLFKLSPFNGQRVLNIAYFLTLSSKVWIFFQTFFSEPSFLLTIVTEARQEFNIAHFFVLSNAFWNIFSFFWKLISNHPAEVLSDFSMAFNIHHILHLSSEVFIFFQILLNRLSSTSTAFICDRS